MARGRGVNPHGPTLTGAQLRRCRQPDAAARLAAWGVRRYGSLAAAARAIGVGRNVLRYAADAGYRATVARTNAKHHPTQWARTKADPGALADHRTDRRVAKRVVHFAPPHAIGRASWCGRANLEPLPDGARGCRACLRIAERWVDEEYPGT